MSLNSRVLAKYTLCITEKSLSTVSSEQSQMKSQRASTETLKNIRETCKRTEEERRRLELESGLYKRWRYGLCDDILLEAKSDHTALAKMNWLDKQVMKHAPARKSIREVSISFFFCVFLDRQTNGKREGRQRE